MMPVSVRADPFFGFHYLVPRDGEFCQQVPERVLMGEYAYPHRITPFTTYRSRIDTSILDRISISNFEPAAGLRTHNVTRVTLASIPDCYGEQMTCGNAEPSESSSAIEIAMDGQLPDDIEIGYSASRMLGLIGLAVIMTLLSASIAFNWFAYQNIDGFILVVAYAGVENITTWDYRRQKCIVLKISPALESQLFASKAKRAMLLANRAVGVDGVAISPSGLTMDFDALLKICMTYYAAVKSSRVVRPPASAVCDGRGETVANGLTQAFASDDAAASSSG
jgi:hypothetical protein